MEQSEKDLRIKTLMYLKNQIIKAHNNLIHSAPPDNNTQAEIESISNEEYRLVYITINKQIEDLRNAKTENNQKESIRDNDNQIE